jgi:PAS domain S-box-containing protein
MMHSLDGEFRVLNVNEYWLRVLGYDREGVIGHSVFEFVTDATRRWAVEKGRPQLFRHGVIREAELQMVKKSGEIVDAILSAVAEKDEQGEVQHTLAFVLDVTERKRAEAARKRTERRLERILESAMDAIVAVDSTLVIRHCNTAAEDVFAAAADELVGSSFQKFACKELAALLEGCIPAFERSGTRKRYMWVPDGMKAVRANGEEFPIEATISQTHDDEERLLTIILRDVNDRIRAERDLRKLRLENVYLREEIGSHYQPGEMVGDSAAFREVLSAAQSVAETDTTVLITGETGTGKELVARLVHAQSKRRDGPLVTVNCAALPSGLIESELFGHEAGAFTGAVSRKVGRFEMADGGTLFLDEVGDLPVELQAKLLRVLQEGEFERVGATQSTRTDVRVVAATNADLQDAVHEQRFRADLFYRLNVFPIHIPPLRERREDIPALVSHFVMRHASKLGKNVSSISKSTMEMLCSYSWPGNVREVQNIVERAVILNAGSELLLGSWFAGPKATQPRPDRVLTLRDLERAHIVEVLEQTGWRVSGEHGAAKILDVKPTSLEARMKRLGIERPHAGASGGATSRRTGGPPDKRKST